MADFGRPYESNAEIHAFLTLPARGTGTKRGRFKIGASRRHHSYVVPSILTTTGSSSAKYGAICLPYVRPGRSSRRCSVRSSSPLFSSASVTVESTSFSPRWKNVLPAIWRMFWAVASASVLRVVITGVAAEETATGCRRCRGRCGVFAVPFPAVPPPARPPRPASRRPGRSSIARLLRRTDRPIAIRSSPVAGGSRLDHRTHQVASRRAPALRRSSVTSRKFDVSSARNDV